MGAEDGLTNGHCIEAGTLLGAWRNGKFIPHDDDFDYAMFFNTFEPSEACNVLRKLKMHMDSFLESTPYETRLISTYADKLELFDPRHGTFVLPGEFYHGANYHYVTIDVQAYIMA